MEPAAADRQLSTRLIPTLAVAAVLALAACGGDDDGVATEDFLAEANGVCSETRQQIDDLYAQEGPTSSFEENVAFQGMSLPIYEGAVEKLSVIEAPDDVADAYDEYLALREEQLDLQRQLQQAGEAGDRAAYFELQRQLGDGVFPLERAREEVGMKSCAVEFEISRVQAETQAVPTQ